MIAARSHLAGRSDWQRQLAATGDERVRVDASDKCVVNVSPSTEQYGTAATVGHCGSQGVARSETPR